MKAAFGGVFLLLSISQAMAFLPQFYETAEVTPGEGSLLASVAPETYGYGFFDWYTDTGVQLELSGRYAFNEEYQLAIFGYAGGLIGLNGPGIILTENPDIGILPNGGIGFQGEFMEKPSLAGQLSIEFPSLISLTLLAGINSRKSGREVVTIGLKSLAYYPSMAFINVHPTSNLHLSLGASMIPLLGDEVHAGVGYTILNK